MLISRSHSRPRRLEAVAGWLLAGLVLACSGEASDGNARMAPLSGGVTGVPGQPPPMPPAAPGSATPEAAGGVNPAEPASPAAPPSSEAPATPPTLDPSEVPSPPASPPAATPPEPTPPEPTPPEPTPPEPTPPPPTPPAVPPAGDATAASCVPAEGAATGLRLTPLITGLEDPTFVTAAPGDPTRLYVLERGGAIRVVLDGQLLPEPFLDLRGGVATTDEEGLVGLAFHPSYGENGRFFVQYARLDPARVEGDDEQIVLSEFARSATNPDRADATSERTLMVVEQPAEIHLAGMLAFGPRDGMLYISRGDGGTNGGPQDTERYFGKILRIDVDGASDDQPYGIPEGNMGGDGVLPEIWNMGLRNPWRFSFDSCTGDLYIGDVGENTFEEINVEPANTPGRNYGWKTVEGLQCVAEPGALPDAGAPVCDTSGFVEPTLTYTRDFGCAVIGGYVYRGQRIPGLRGTYLYADYCFGNFGSFRFEGGQAVGAANITADINPGAVEDISSFGVDNAGELYVLSLAGTLFRIDPD